MQNWIWENEADLLLDPKNLPEQIPATQQGSAGDHLDLPAEVQLPPERSDENAMLPRLQL